MKSGSRDYLIGGYRDVHYSPEPHLEIPVVWVGEGEFRRAQILRSWAMWLRLWRGSDYSAFAKTADYGRQKQRGRRGFHPLSRWADDHWALMKERTFSPEGHQASSRLVFFGGDGGGGGFRLHLRGLAFSGCRILHGRMGGSLTPECFPADRDSALLRPGVLRYHAP